MVNERSAVPADDTKHGSVRAPVMVWPTLPDMPVLTASTIIPEVGGKLLLYSSDIILKMDIDDGEAVMTELAHDILGSIVPHVDALVSVQSPRASMGMLITRRPGEPLVELWPDLTDEQRTAVKASLATLLVRMRASHERFDYFGRPEGKPYVTLSLKGPYDEHDFCRSRADWDASRIRALYSAASFAEVSDNRLKELEQTQHYTAHNDTFVNRPVLTHGDLSDRNILADPSTLEITGLIDWGLANVAPAYFEYANVCLCEGHQPEWRKEMLEVMGSVLRIECEREIAQHGTINGAEPEKDLEDLFRQTLASWKALVNVERPAQYYSDECYWTFEHESIVY